MWGKIIVKFTGRHRKELLDPMHAVQLQEQIDGLVMPEETRRSLKHILSRDTAAECKWTFIMLSPQQNAAVVDWLSRNSKRGKEALRLWAELFTAMRMDTGEIMMTRDELAEVINVSPTDVSRIMSELESINAISRRLVRIGGVKGPGRVHYFMNPAVATSIAGNAARQEAQDKAGQLSIFDVIDGGKPD